MSIKEFITKIKIAFFMMFTMLITNSCMNKDPNKYEVKSPCVAADIGTKKDAPCQKRKVNPDWLG